MDANNIIELWKGIYLFDLLRYLIPASIAFLIFWVVGRKTWNHLFIQKVFPKQRQLWHEFAYSMSTVLIFSIIGIGVFKSEKAGITLIYHNLDDYGIPYMIGSLIFTIVFHDFYFYWTHRFMHHKKVFKFVHRVHHESTNPSPWAAYSFHPFEAIIQAMVLPILIFIVPLHDLTLFIFLAYMIIRNVIGHLGFEILPKGFTRNKWLNWNTAITHHNLHHKNFNTNYGLYFSWWDNLMKTTDERYHETFDEVKSRPKSCELKANRKKTVTLSILLLLALSPTKGQSVSGQWMTYNEQTGSSLSIIEIAEVSKSIEGKIIKIFLEPYQGEDPICTNCSGERKDQRVVGMNFLWSFKKEGNTWSTGKILDPQNGEVYDSKIWLEDKSTLKVRGYGGPLGLFYRTQTWKRDSTTPGEPITGTWKTIDDHWNKVKSMVEIKNENGELKGYVTKIYLLPNEGTDPVCTECDGDLKGAKIIGMKIIWSFQKNGDKWEDGKILDPGNGNAYSSSIELIDKDTLQVRGYLGPFFKSQIWKRVN
jgi:lathosterol oxidase